MKIDLLIIDILLTDIKAENKTNSSFKSSKTSLQSLLLLFLISSLYYSCLVVLCFSSSRKPLSLCKLIITEHIASGTQSSFGLIVFM